VVNVKKLGYISRRKRTGTPVSGAAGPADLKLDLYYKK